MENWASYLKHYFSVEKLSLSTNSHNFLITLAFEIIAVVIIVVTDLTKFVDRITLQGNCMNYFSFSKDNFNHSESNTVNTINIFVTWFEIIFEFEYKMKSKTDDET